MLWPSLLEIHRVVQFLLHLESFKQLLQVRDKVDDGRYDEDCDEHTPSPVFWGKVAVTHGTHRDHDEVVGLKECEVVVDVNAKEVVKHTYPECVCVCM